MNAYRNAPNRRVSQDAPAQTALVAFAVDEGQDGGKAHWTRIGRMLPHKDGKGFVLLLSAMPVQNRIVVREETPRPYNGRNGGNAGFDAG